MPPDVRELFSGKMQVAREEDIQSVEDGAKRTKENDKNAHIRPTLLVSPFGYFHAGLSLGGWHWHLGTCQEPRALKGPRASKGR